MIVSMDFATSVIPGWHTTFPPYFVRCSFLRFRDGKYIAYYVSINLEYITIQHIEIMNIVIMITGSIVGVAYITELFYGLVFRS
jgi:molybdopterin-containing oxidoreductase family membrane subunit